MKSKKDTSPVRSRDKVLQSLYEIELSGSSAQEILKDLSLQSRYPHFKDLLKGVVDSKEDIDNTLSKEVLLDLLRMKCFLLILMYPSLLMKVLDYQKNMEQRTDINM